MMSVIRMMILSLAAVLFLSGTAGAGVPEPSGYREKNFRSPVPGTLKGAEVVSIKRAWQLWQQGNTVFIDVMPQAPKPKNLPAGTFWRDKTRDNIPGSYWLANVGYGRLHPDADKWFQDRLKLLTGGNKMKPVLFYCLMDCWMSWNAAKRALEYGYSHVFWFPEGSDGWAFEDFPLKARYPTMYTE